MASDLEKEIEAVGAYTKIVVKFQNDKSTKFKVLKDTLIPKMDKATSDKELKAAKEECNKQLDDVSIDNDAQKDMLDDLEKHIAAAKTALTAEQKRIEDLKKNLKEISKGVDEHNKKVKEFNKKADKKSQKKLLKVPDDIGKMIAESEKTAKDAVGKISGAEAFLKIGKGIQGVDKTKIQDKRTLVKNKEFQSKTPAGV